MMGIKFHLITIYHSSVVITHNIMLASPLPLAPAVTAVLDVDRDTGAPAAVVTFSAPGALAPVLSGAASVSGSPSVESSSLFFPSTDVDIGLEMSNRFMNILQRIT